MGAWGDIQGAQVHSDVHSTMKCLHVLSHLAVGLTCIEVEALLFPFQAAHAVLNFLNPQPPFNHGDNSRGSTVARPAPLRRSLFLLRLDDRIPSMAAQSLVCP